jgi:6-phosphogluconolactonase (cycloisomerase 2 family)
MARKLLVVIAAIAISMLGAVPVFAAAPAMSSTDSAGAVYIMSNSPSGNQILVYNRAADGSLAYAGSFATGGSGSGVGTTVPPDPLGSQNSVLLSPDGQWLFAVNAGSNEVSSFKVMPGSLSLADKVSSGGSYPVSLTYSEGLLYVLNAAGDGSISGFKVQNNGRLKALKGSTRSLHAATPAMGAQPQILESPAEVGFSPDGNFLVITDKGGVSGVGKIDVFKVNKGLPSGSYMTTQTAGAVPFDFTFDRYGHLVAVDASTGSVTSYTINHNGSLSVNSVAFTGQAATCWVTSRGGNIYTDNTGSGTLSGFTPSHAGGLTPVTASSIVGTAGAGTLPLDIGMSRNGQFVYSLETGAGMIGIFQLNADGTLTSLGTAGGYAAVSGFQGIAVR